VAEKSHFSDLVANLDTPASPTQKACGNCAHARNEPADVRFVRCKAGPPTVVPYMVNGQVALKSEWPALRRTAECDAFVQKPIDVD
jgi:hypothetical protein